MRLRLIISAFAILAQGLEVNGGELWLPELFADHMVLQRDAGIRVWGRATPGETVAVSMRGEKQSAITDENGYWDVTLPATRPGPPFEVRISTASEEKILRDVLVGDVWLCAGQSNMGFRMAPNLPWSAGVLDYENEIANSEDPDLRIFTSPILAAGIPQRDPHGIWLQADPSIAGNFSAVAYYFGLKLREQRDIPIGIIVAAVGGSSISSWMEADLAASTPGFREKMEVVAIPEDAFEDYQRGLPAYLEKARIAMKENRKAPAYKEPFKGFRYQPSFIYNAMIAPFTQFPITGFVWYQGEADTRIASHYGDAFKALILDWRRQWKQPDAAFLFVQLAGYDPVANGHDAATFGQAWADQRGAQAEALALPHTGMAVAADLGDPKTVHPRDKKSVGERLALAAGKLVDGDFPATPGPQAESAKIVDRAITISFHTISPLEAVSASRAALVQLADKNGKIVEVMAIIEGSSAVSAPIPEGFVPIVIRYAWENYPELWIYDTDGLPAPPFQLSLIASDPEVP